MLALADAARLRFVRLLGPLARPLLVSRDVRVAWTGAALVASALVLTSALPVWVLALGPIVWGVPHVLADVRYVVVQPGYHRRALVAAPAAAGVVAAWAGLGLRAVLAGAAVAALFARGSRARRAAVSGAALGLAAVAHLAPAAATLVFAHLHNVVAVAFFVLWRRGGHAVRWAPAALFAVLATAVLGGALDPAIARAAPLANATFDDLVDQLAPPSLVAWSGVPRLPERLVLLYAFGQSVHYAMWLRLVPEEARPSPRPRSFRQSLRALRADVGAPVLAVAAAVALFVAAWALVDLAGARIKYLQFAFFHGWIELVAAAVMLVEARGGETAAAGG